MLTPWLLAAFWSLTTLALNLTSVQDNSGFTFILGGLHYYISHEPIFSIPTHNTTQSATYPVSSIHLHESHIDHGYLISVLDGFGILDDVWSPSFLQNLFITSYGSRMGSSTLEWIASINVTRLFVAGQDIAIDTALTTDIDIIYVDVELPPGPYLVVQHANMLAFHTVYRLYPDQYLAFVTGAVRSRSQWLATNITVQLHHDTYPIQYIPVPSRLYSASSSLPLAGKRFVLKDIFDVQGLQTMAGSVAFAQVYPTLNSTASSVQKLLDLGAILVGKTRTSQFAHGANPWEFIDFSYSWNPRGDMYLTAASSSSGSAVAIAGYPWVDFAVGSDTRGSVRKPASLVGAYGIRPSFGSMGSDGVLPLAEEMDTISFFARDPGFFVHLARLWYNITITSSSLPTYLLYPVDHFPVTNPEAQLIYDNFVKFLVDELNFTVIPINSTSLLEPLFPEHNFTKFYLSSNVLAEYYSYLHVGKPLIETYQAIFGSDVYPSFDIVPERVYTRAASLTRDDYDQAVIHKHEFRRTFEERIIKAHPKSCADSITIYDIGTGGLPSYRIEDFNDLSGAVRLLQTTPSRVSEGLNYLASAAGLPEITVPLGQVRYRSHVTREQGMLPVAVQLVSRQGCDGMLLKLLEVLSQSNIITETKTGSTAF